VNNPYYLGAKEVREASRFTHREQDIYLVSRLDAFTVEEALALVDKAKSAGSEGKFVLDQRAALVNRTGEDWLEVAAKRLEAQGMGDRVMLDSSPQGVRNVPNVLGYYSWGSNDPRNRVRTFGMGFVPGSLAATFVSSDARTFKQPPAEWVPSDSADPTKSFGGTPQSLIGDLIHEGATGVAGHVAEPYLQSTVRPEILFPAYVAGFNLIEAFYLATPHLSWQTVIVGDPLCAPFPRKPLSREEIEDPIESTTALPGAFSARRIAMAIRQFPGVAESVVRLVVRAETLVATGGDQDGARAALEEATKSAPNVPPFELQLALLYEQSGQFDRAAERYQRVIDVQPNNSIALNNLAYAIAVRRKSPAEALPLAKRAAAGAPNDGTVLDTLAWIEHLLGDEATAAKQIAQAVARASGNPEIRLHAAVIYAASGARAVAEIELKEALRLDPSLESRDEVRQVRSALAKLGSVR
jgi:Flp pilus assembly protein TadD